MSKLNKQFSATLQKSPNKGGWTYIVWPESANFFNTRGLVKVKGTIDGQPFKSHKLPVNTNVPKIIKKEEGDDVTIVLKERIKAK